MAIDVDLLARVDSLEAFLDGGDGPPDSVAEAAAKRLLDRIAKELEALDVQLEPLLAACLDRSELAWADKAIVDGQPQAEDWKIRDDVIEEKRKAADEARKLRPPRNYKIEPLLRLYIYTARKLVEAQRRNT